MQTEINKAKELSISILKKFGFNEEESTLITENFIEAELTGKKTHGLIRIPWTKKQIESHSVSVNNESVEIIKETPVSILIDGKNKTGYYVVNKAIEIGLERVNNSGILGVGVTNTAPASGMIGLYARKAAEQDLIFIGFNNSSGGLIPYGAIKEMLGTNPLTVGIPTNELPIILDMASSQITWGELLLAKNEGRKLPEGVAMDSEGTITTDPNKAIDGGLLPFSSYKGSGLAFIVEIIGGALTSSRVGNNVPGGWGSFFLLINPNLFRDINEFKKDVQTSIDELKNLPKAQGIEEIFYPGEKSQLLRKQNLEKGIIDIQENLYQELLELSK